MKNIEVSKETLKKYFIDKAKLLSLDYEELKKIDFDLSLGDYLTEDIANDWFDEEVDVLSKLCLDSGKSNKCAILYDKINKNFIAKSESQECNSIQSIWNLESLKNSSFWNEQRQLARLLIKELEKL